MSKQRYPKYESMKKKNKKSLYERFIGLFKDMRRILKVANKPDRENYFMTFKICGIGLLILGVLSYVIQLIFTIISEIFGF
jgi:protein translocase SEC61 complex gamma subunit